MQRQYTEAVAVTELRSVSKQGHYDTRLYVLPDKDGLWRRLSTKAIREMTDEPDATVQAALVRDGKVMHRIDALKVTAFKKYLQVPFEELKKLIENSDHPATMTVGSPDEGSTLFEKEEEEITPPPF
jgi:hypothetical protein